MNGKKIEKTKSELHREELSRKLNTFRLENSGKSFTRE